MAYRSLFENSNEIGVFAKLTNSYCLLSAGGSENFYNSFETEIGSSIPIIHCTISGIRIIGRLVSGNKRGLLLPQTINDYEFKQIRNALPEDVVVKKVGTTFSALGNYIACNDFVGLINPELDKETEEIISDVLGIEVFKTTIADSGLLGTYICFNNKGGLVHPLCTVEELDEISNLLQIPITAGTVNRGSEVIGGGLVVNDTNAFCEFKDYKPLPTKQLQQNRFLRQMIKTNKIFNAN